MSFSLLSTIILFLMAFLIGFTFQLSITYYQGDKILDPITESTRNIESLSQFQNAINDSLSYLEEYRWDYSDTGNLLALLEKNITTATYYLTKVETDLSKIGRKQYLLTSAITTTYKQFETFQNQLIISLLNGKKSESANLYYDKISPCGRYLTQYCQELLEIAILDNHETHTNLLQINAQLNNIQSIVLILCVFFGVIMVLSVFRLVWFLKKMAKASRLISGGKFDIPDIIYFRNDEMGYLVSAFNEMKHSMKEQVRLLEERNQMETELLTKENEALGLQNLLEVQKMQQLNSQINPHFLFNTLNVIKYTAQEENADKTQSLLSSLAKIYRYVLTSNSSQVSLSREIQIVEEFYALYRIRFRDRLKLNWTIAKNLDVTEIVVPSFILQPIVENAIKHGLGQKEEEGTISILILAQDKSLKITIQDNGVGINPEKLNEVKANLQNPPLSGSHIGLYNVAARLKLWSKESGLDICSFREEGTTIVMWMPLVLESELIGEDNE